MIRFTLCMVLSSLLSDVVHAFTPIPLVNRQTLTAYTHIRLL